MRTVPVVFAWVTVIGFPIEPFEACELAESCAVELRRQVPDFEVRAACATPLPDTGRTIDHDGPQSILRGGDSV